ncbi:MAG TPA: YdcF family protein [Bryobacteraceae bacterium]|nr:YdcF family protein [Bryobacteraceae bacterium]
MRRLLGRALAACAVLVVLWLGWIMRQIYRQSWVDEARPADVIIVLGAAEYRGRPSPVLRARLDHALELYRRKLAPRIITTGGAGGDPFFTEGEVARDYLVRNGVPSEMIMVEDRGESTFHSTVVAAEMMRRMGQQSCIVVSDGYHIFRVKKMLQFRGLAVYGSPRPAAPKGTWREWWLYLRQSIGFLLWEIGITI